ncbi:unnamed protein product [Caenorhabditis brenneri]
MNQGMRMIPTQGPAQNQNSQAPSPWRAFLAEHLAQKPFALNQALQPNRAATQARNHDQQPWQPALQNRAPALFAAPFNLFPAQVTAQNQNVQAPSNRGIQAPSSWREFLVGHLAQNPLGQNQAPQLNQAAAQTAQNAAQTPNQGQQPGHLALPNSNEIIGLMPREALHNEEAVHQLTPRALADGISALHGPHQNQQNPAQAQPLRGQNSEPTLWIVPREAQATLAGPLGLFPGAANQIVAHVAAQARRNRGMEARHRRIQVAIQIPMPALAPSRDIQAPTVANQKVEDDDDDVIFLGEHQAPDPPE